MSQPDGKHVFISYVREDADAVDALCAILEAAQIPYWRDRSALGPGDAWRAKIREAIRQGSLVFLACFSENSRAKDRSYMNEELTLAVEEFRKMPPGRTWIIPVRFDDGDVPDWDLGAGRMLSDFNYCDLFGPRHVANAAGLVTTILRLTGEKRPDAATALAAVEQATNAGRADLMTRMTKELLPDPARRIELDDLISQEVRRVMAVLSDEDRVAGPHRGSNDELVVRAVKEVQDLWSITEPFCASLRVAARWGAPDALSPWATGLRSFVGAANKMQGGVDALLFTRHLPGVAGMVTATLAAASSGRWDNLKILVANPSVRDRYEQKALPILEATSPHKPYAVDWISNTLAFATINGVDVEDALKEYTERRRGKYHTPEAEWLHHVLRPLFADQMPDEDSYDAEYDRAEVILGVIAQDVVNVQRAAAGNDGRYYGRSHWYGRSTWRANRSYGNPVADLAQELAANGPTWEPLRANLFGGDAARAQAALEAYGENFAQVARQRF
jgi:hypothetical protein